MNKIVFNSLVLYAKIIISMIISLWTVPLVLKALGEADYGLYSLVAGVVAMLAFLNGAMTVATQRYLSVTLGERNNAKLREVFSVAIVLHVIIGLVVVALVEGAAPLLFDHVLNIDAARVATAHRLLHYLVVSIFFSIMMVPFDATLNAYENLLTYSIIGVIDSLLRLAVAATLAYVLVDRLDFYGVAMAAVVIIIFATKAIYVRRKYRVLQDREAIKHALHSPLFKEMAGFAGLSTLSTLALVVRNQGLAVVLNHFFGVIANAAYGIANQVNGVLGYFSSTIQKSVNPQLMQSEGMGDRTRLHRYSIALGQWSTWCLMIVAVPLAIALPWVLQLWLKDVPEHTVELTRWVIMLSILYQMSAGLMSAIQASGQIKYYTMSVALLLLATLPIAWAMMETTPLTTLPLMIACAIEFITFFVRLSFAKRLVDMPATKYFLRVALLPIVVVIALALFAKMI